MSAIMSGSESAGDVSCGSFATESCAMKIGPCRQCHESDRGRSRCRPSRWAKTGPHRCYVKCCLGWVEAALSQRVYAPESAIRVFRPYAVRPNIRSGILHSNAWFAPGVDQRQLRLDVLDLPRHLRSLAPLSPFNEAYRQRSEAVVLRGFWFRDLLHTEMPSAREWMMPHWTH
jgi:hypothetical protein